MRQSPKCPVVALLLIFLAAWGTLQAQEGRRGGPEGGPPWMRGGPRGGPEGGPPWMRGGPGGRPEGDRRDRGGSDADRNERMLGMLRSMDSNRNGILEPNEIPEYRRSFVSMIVTRMGGDPNKRIDLNALSRSASRAGSRGAASSTSSTSIAAKSNYDISADPLVPYFGEKEDTATPITAFGQKEPEAKTAAVAARTTGPALSQSDQILRSAREIMSRYDKNKNGTLDKDKGEWVSSLPFKADSADTNRDGRISMTELIAVLGGKSGVTTGAAAVSTRQSIAYERIPTGMPDWFFERDKDQDGQITMMEYANGQPWTEAMVGEFEFLDRNNDGVATAQEIFSALKEFDEQKKLKEELAKREIERRKGAGAAEAPKEGDKPAEPPKEGEKKPGQPPGPPKEGDEKAPDWKPAAKPEPGAIPTTGPYATGSDSDRRRSGQDGGQRGTRRGSYRRSGD